MTVWVKDGTFHEGTGRAEVICIKPNGVVLQSWGTDKCKIVNKDVIIAVDITDLDGQTLKVAVRHD